MSQEIVFTSSERGLRAGSTGFCTVRSTVGMPQNLASLLEQLTGYTHPYDAYDRSLFDKHPVNFAHYISRVGGQRFHILCRICNAPLDHTNRSNKLAHLIAFEEGEIDLSHTQGPAAAIHWMIPPAGKKQQAGDSRYWITSWPSDQEPCVLPDSNRLVLPSVNDNPGRCSVWKQVLGDSGWAAVLAESAQDRKRQSVPVVFSSDQKDKCLDLVQEALSLLPPAERWGVTFSTFQSGSLPTKVECRWQFLLDSTDLAQKAIRNQHRTPVIDLTSLKGMQSPASELANFTNSGKRPWDKASVSLSRPSAPKQPAAVPPKRSAASAHSVDDHGEDLDSRPGGYSLRKSRSNARVHDEQVPRLQRQQKNGNRRRKDAIGIVIGVAGVCVIAAFIKWGQPLLEKQTPIDTHSSQLLTAAKEKHEELVRIQRKKEKNERQRSEAETAQSASVGEQQEAVAVNEQDGEKPEPKQLAALTPVQEKKDVIEIDETVKGPQLSQKPFDYINANMEQMKLPDWETNLKGPKVLANVEIDDPRNCKLELTGVERTLTQGGKFKHKPVDTHIEGHRAREWKVTYTSGSALARRESDVGLFRLHHKKLTFQWVGNDPKLARHLANTGIKLTGSNDTHENDVVEVGFRQALVLQPFTLPKGDASRKIEFPEKVIADQISNYTVKLHIDIGGIADRYDFESETVNEFNIKQWDKLNPTVDDGVVQLNIAATRPGVSNKIRIKHRAGPEQFSFFELHLSLFYKSNEKRLELRTEQQLSVPVFTVTDGVKPEPSQEYYFTKFDKDYRDNLTKWILIVKKVKESQPMIIRKLNQMIKQAEDAPGVVTANPKSAQQAKINELKTQLEVEKKTQDNCKTADIDLKKTERWYKAVHEDISYLITNLQIDFDLQYEDPNGPRVTLVTTKGYK